MIVKTFGGVRSPTERGLVASLSVRVCRFGRMRRGGGLPMRQQAEVAGTVAGLVMAAAVTEWVEVAAERVAGRVGPAAAAGGGCCRG